MTSTLGGLPDLLDFLEALNEAGAQYLVIGGHAVGLHGHSRATKDLDVWIGTDNSNRAAIVRGLLAFGAPPSIARTLESAAHDEFVFLGRPPMRIDLLQTIPGIDDFEQAHSRRVEVTVDGVKIDVVGLEDLLVAKRAAGRPQDLADVHHLEKIRSEVTGA